MKSRLQLLKTLKYILDEGSENSPVKCENQRLKKVIVSLRTEIRKQDEV